jgi:hypothetical protein
MEEMPQTPVTPAPQKKTNVWLIAGIAAVVLCCCCVVAAVLAWNYGDYVMHALGVY